MLDSEWGEGMCWSIARDGVFGSHNDPNGLAVVLLLCLMGVARGLKTPSDVLQNKEQHGLLVLC